MDDEEWLSRDDALNMLASTVRVAKVTKSSSSGAGDTVQGHEDGAPSDEQFDLAARRIWPFGIRSVPPAGVDAVWVRSGGNTNGVMVAAESSRFGPSDLADGEVAFYNKVAGVLLKLFADGHITINAAPGQTVQIGGATYAMPLYDGSAGTTGLVAALYTLAKQLSTAASVANVAAAGLNFGKSLNGGDATLVAPPTALSSTNASNG